MRPSTYSIVGADPAAGECGVAVQSKFLSVGAIVPFARGGAGAVATQSFADVTFGPRGLDLLQKGNDPASVIGQLLDGDADAAQRQVGVIAADGRAASYTGEGCFEYAGAVSGQGFSAQGNILTGKATLDAMAETFSATEDRLAVRLLAALRAGEEAGGEKRGVESAALLVVKPGGGYGGNHDRMIDLRVDHSDDPIGNLGQLLDSWDLYFLKSPPDTWLTLDPELRTEVHGLLESAGRIGEGETVGQALLNYVGWENLEERWIDEDHLDPEVLVYMRRHLS